MVILWLWSLLVLGRGRCSSGQPSEHLDVQWDFRARPGICATSAFICPVSEQKDDAQLHAETGLGSTAYHAFSLSPFGLFVTHLLVLSSLWFKLLQKFFSYAAPIGK